MNNSLLFDASGKIEYTWQNAIVLDPGTEPYKEFLINQTKEHLTSLTMFNGLSVDRVDHTILFNFGRDDGISWCGQPCASMLIAWKRLMKEISELIHGDINTSQDRSLIITTNYQTSRMDLLLGSDGIFTEKSDKSHLVSVGLSSMGMASIMWVYNPDEILKDVNGPHVYFQERLFMNVQLMAPVYGADHSIVPDSSVQVYYNQYGPLFKALRGSIWWLSDNTVDIMDNNEAGLLVNSFLKNKNGNIVIVLALGDWNVTQVSVNVTGSEVGTCQSLNVKSDGKWTDVTVIDNRIVNETNLAYGCSVIECTRI